MAAGLLTSVDAWAYNWGGRIARRAVKIINSTSYSPADGAVCPQLLRRLSAVSPAYAKCMSSCLTHGRPCFDRCNSAFVELVGIALEFRWTSEKYPNHLSPPSMHIGAPEDMRDVLQMVSDRCLAYAGPMSLHTTPVVRPSDHVETNVLCPTSPRTPKAEVAEPGKAEDDDVLDSLFPGSGIPITIPGARMGDALSAVLKPVGESSEDVEEVELITALPSHVSTARYTFIMPPNVQPGQYHLQVLGYKHQAGADAEEYRWGIDSPLRIRPTPKWLKKKLRSIDVCTYARTTAAIHADSVSSLLEHASSNMTGWLSKDLTLAELMVARSIMKYTQKSSISRGTSARALGLKDRLGIVFMRLQLDRNLCRRVGKAQLTSELLSNWKARQAGIAQPRWEDIPTSTLTDMLRRIELNDADIVSFPTLELSFQPSPPPSSPLPPSPPPLPLPPHQKIIIAGDGAMLQLGGCDPAASHVTACGVPCRLANVGGTLQTDCLIVNGDAPFPSASRRMLTATQQGAALQLGGCDPDTYGDLHLHQIEAHCEDSAACRLTSRDGALISSCPMPPPSPPMQAQPGSGRVVLVGDVTILQLGGCAPNGDTQSCDKPCRFTNVDGTLYTDCEIVAPSQDSAPI